MLVPLALAIAFGLPAGAGLATAASHSATGASPCPTIAEIETAIGFPVRAVPIAVDGCMYELTGRYRGAFVTLMYQPATRAEDLFGEIRENLKAQRPGAQPNRLSIGEGGWGYASSGQHEAGAVSKGRLYYVRMDFGILTIPAREDAAPRVVELAMRTAPGTTSASGGATAASAALDACLLATNAEVSRIAEEKPEFAAMWSAPMTAYGGAHCQYGGGTIRVYQGKGPAAALEGMLKAFKADQEPRVPVPGLGDKAFFMIPKPNDRYNRFGLLAVYAGPRVLQLTLDARGEEPITATQPRLVRFAQLVLPRLGK